MKISSILVFLIVTIAVFNYIPATADNSLVGQVADSQLAQFGGSTLLPNVGKGRSTDLDIDNVQGSGTQVQGGIIPPHVWIAPMAVVWWAFCMFMQYQSIRFQHQSSTGAEDTPQFLSGFIISLILSMGMVLVWLLYGTYFSSYSTKPILIWICEDPSSFTIATLIASLFPSLVTLATFTMFGPRNIRDFSGMALVLKREVILSTFTVVGSIASIVSVIIALG